MGMKRANGTGSVYKMKHKPLRKPYRAVMTTGWTDDGKAIRKTIGTFAKAQQAWDALSAYAAAPEAFDNKDATFAQCWDWMVEDKRRRGVNEKAASFDLYKSKLDRVMRMRMADVRALHLQEIIDSQEKKSSSYLKHLKSYMNGVFKEALKNDVVSKNYAALVTLPSMDTTSDMHRPFTDEEVYTLWQHTDDKDAKAMLIFIYTGMRPGELFQIQLDNVHLKERYMIGGIKTEAGKDRIIPIAECIYPFVQELYAMAHFKQSKTLIVPRYVGKYFYDPLALLCERIGIPKHRPHDGRHTFITWCSRFGVPEHLTKAIVGHAQKDITNSVYVHRSVSQLIDVVNRLPHHEKLIEGCATVEQRRHNSSV
jgi:integrase